jgi:hypothetical protein
MPEFLEAINPRISVISSGEDNPYGHPSPELLQRQQEKGTRVLRTDLDGSVQILTDGQAIKVSCYRACRGSAGRISERGGAKSRREPAIGAEIPASPDVRDFCGIAAS